MSRSPLSSCRPYQRGIVDLIDGVDSVEARERLVAHAEGCARCALELARAVELRRLIDSAEEPEISADSETAFIEQVLAGIDDGRPDAATARARPVARLQLTFVVAAAATVLLLARLWDGLAPEDSPPAVTDRLVSQRVAQGASSSADHGLRADTTAQAEVGSTYALPAKLSGETETTAESTAEYTVEPAPEPITKTASLQFDAGESGESIDRIQFEGLLDVASEACSFDPRLDGESEEWMAALAAAAQSEGYSQSTVLRSARELLREESSSVNAPFAARILGRRADLRDRRLLTDSLAATGAAGALALCERGSVGVELLWKIAASKDEGALPLETRTMVERALIQWNSEGRDALTDSLDLSLNVPLAATLLAQSGPGAAKELLARYLERGDVRWRDAWLAAPLHEDALGEALGDALRRRTRGKGDLRTQRLLMAVEEAAFVPGLEFTMAALSSDYEAAAAALVALPGEEPLAALMGAAQAGRLQPEWEDFVWGLFAERRSESLFAFASGAGAGAADRAAFTLSRLALVVGGNPAARRSLLRLGICPELLTEHRVRALLLAVDGYSSGSAPSVARDLVPDLRALTQEDPSTLAAAAWIALWQLGEEHPSPEDSLASALARPGPLTVRHLRVAREVRRARASGSRPL